MDGDILNSSVTAVETSDAPIIIESSKVSSISMESMASTDAVAPRGEKRERKPKGSNVPGSRSLSKMGANRMDYDDDVLDRVDFSKITKRDHQVGKRRKLQECPLDDALSYRQKAAVDEITYLFPQMSPKTIMTETLKVLNTASSAWRRTTSMKGDLRRSIIIGVEVARQTVQHLAANSARAQKPAEFMSSRCL